MTLRRLRAASLLCLTLALGCKDGDAALADGSDGVDPSADDDDGAAVTGTGSTGPAPGSGDDDGDDGPPQPSTGDGVVPDPPIVFDLGLLPDTPGLSQQCTKVDFMFVVDNSGSMFEEQINLTTNFPTFISGIQDSLEEVQSYQVGVITSDMYAQFNKPECNQLSSLVVQTNGTQSSNSICAMGPDTTYADGFNYMTENDDLATTFSCAAQVGTSGSGSERPMQAVVEAVQRLEGDPGDCNEGYLRDDALLVIVVITDEADGPGDPDGLPPSSSVGDPQSWYDEVVAAKGGIPENVVVLALVNYAGGPCPPLSAFDDGANIVTFAQMFGPNGFVGGICEADYGPIFQQAIGVIDEACENFIPPD